MTTPKLSMLVAIALFAPNFSKIEAKSEEIACKFVTSCANTSPCEDRELAISVRQEGEEYILDLPGFSLPATLGVDLGGEAKSFLTVFSNYTRHMLSIYPDESAVLTVHTHVGEAAAITLFGRCKPP